MRAWSARRRARRRLPYTTSWVSACLKVLEVREELCLVEELRLLQMREPAPQGLLRQLGDRRQKRVGHVLTDHRGRLQEPLLLRR